MKVAIVSPYDISKTGGVTNHVINLAKELTCQGNKVSIIAFLLRHTKYYHVTYIGYLFDDGLCWWEYE